jgi:hypothetical protein
MSCEKIQEQIPEFVAGNLSPEEAKTLQRHCDECVSCREEVRKQGILLRGLKGFYQDFSPGKESTSFSLPRDLPSDLPHKAPSVFDLLQSVRFWIPALSFAVVIGLIIYTHGGLFSRGPSAPSSGIITEPATDSELLAGGSLQSPTSSEIIQPGQPLQLGHSYQALQETTIRHTPRIQVCLAKGGRLQLLPGGISLQNGAGRFKIQPGNQPVHLETPLCRIEILGTELDVATNEKATAVHLRVGKIAIHTQAGLTPMLPGETTLTVSGSGTAKVSLPGNLWEFFSREPGTWEQRIPGNSTPLPPLAASAPASTDPAGSAPPDGPSSQSVLLPASISGTPASASLPPTVTASSHGDNPMPVMNPIGDGTTETLATSTEEVATGEIPGNPDNSDNPDNPEEAMERE